MKVTVLGGGILGLWTSYILRQNGYTVEVLAGSMHEGTTSSAAVCVLTPFFPGDPTTQQFKRSVAWAKTTLKQIQELDAQFDGAFLERVACFEFGLGNNLEADFPVSKLSHLDFTTFDIIRFEDLVVGCDFAVKFDCYLCNTAVFLPWLHGTLIGSGVTFRSQSLRSLKDLQQLRTDVVFNCMGYQTLFPDDELYPVFGQSMYVPVSGQSPPNFGVGAGNHAIFKHRRGFYLGSYFLRSELGDPATPRESLYRESMKFAEIAYPMLCESVNYSCPEIDLAAVQRVNSGVRPFRASGPRVELDRSYGVPVIHNYGHGAHGWTIGYASAVEAVRLLASI